MHPFTARTPQPQLVFDGMRALVADQHTSVRTWLRELLLTLGIGSVAMAGSAIDLIRHLKNAPLAYDIVLCDHHLDPARDGIQLLEELRFQKTLPLSTIFLIVTGERLYPRVVAAAEFAPDDYLIKPFSPSVLQQRLHLAMLRKRHLHVVHELVASDELDRALLACDEILQKKSSHFRLDTLRLKAEILVTQGHIEDASRLYAEISENRMVPWARMGYAMTLHKQGRNAEAESIAEELNQAHPEFLSVYDFMARVKEEEGDLNGASDYLQRAVTIASSLQRLRHLAEIEDAKGDHAKARATLLKIVERTRKSSMLQVSDYVKLLRTTQADGNALEAELLAREMKRDFRGDEKPESRVALALADALTAKHAEKHEEAAAHVDTALTIQSTAKEEVGNALTLELASACIVTGKDEAAEALAEQLSTRNGGRLGASLESLIGKLTRRRAAAAGEATPGSPAVGDPATDTDLPTATPPADPLAAARATSPAEVEALMDETDNSLRSLAHSWSTERAQRSRELLSQVFNAAPRDRRVIEWHIRYNKLAAANGAEHHKPGTKVSH